jgi:energy-coupling factor transport system permease protein
MRDTFSSYHPVINFTYVAILIIFSMVYLHPVLLGISMAGAMSYSIFLNKGRGLRFIMLFLLPGMVAAGLVNPLFNHKGVTILGYLSGNPITLESILYGIAAAMMLGSVLLWFSCVNAVMSSDKLMYLFGAMLPSLSLIISMSLRFVPRFQAQIKTIARGRKCIGKDAGSGNFMQKMRNGMAILSIMITFALESSIDTADSMKSRGYGLPGRTSFSFYRFDARDKAALICILGLSALIAAEVLLETIKIRYFPSFHMSVIDARAAAAYFGYFMLCFAPLLLNITEVLYWQFFRSRI